MDKWNKKIVFINFIGKLSILFLIIQLILNLYIVPLTQNLKQDYLRNSSLNLFPKLIQDKKFTKISKKMTIFVEENKKNGLLKGIYIKEELDNNESKIVIAKNGKLVKTNNGYTFKLLNGKITNIDQRGSINLNFKETTYELSKLKTNIRQENKLNETKSSILISCLDKFFKVRKESIIRCSKENSFSINEIYEEIFQRTINPLYIVILSLLSSLLVIKPKIDFIYNNLKIILFGFGFLIIIFSQLSYKFIFFKFEIEMIFLVLPIVLIFFFYIFLLIKTNFKINLL